MANTKITNLTELTSIADADVLAVVDDTAGTPITKKITKANLVKDINATKIANGSVTNSEFQFINTLSSNAQTQLDSKLGIAPRINTIVSNGTPTTNTDNFDAITITALATAITSMTTNLSGTGVNFQKLIFRIKDDGSARGITWGASFEAKGVALPTTTTTSKVTTVGFIYDTVTSKWGCVASVTEA